MGKSYSIRVTVEVTEGQEERIQEIVKLENRKRKRMQLEPATAEEILGIVISTYIIPGIDLEDAIKREETYQKNNACK